MVSSKTASSWLLAAILLLLNLHLIPGLKASPLIFRPDYFENGQWWRLFTHPFVHVTWYHLLLDAGAFFILHASLEEETAWKRGLYLLASGGGSLLAALFAAPDFSSAGLCGLSGIAHGLMAVCALEMMQGSAGDESLRWMGVAYLALVVSKSVFEALTGHCFFSFLDFGMLGSPQAACHAGGVLGGIVGFLCANGRRKQLSSS